MGQKAEYRSAKRSRALIRQAYTDLLKEKDLNKITVTDIVKKADINRGTFYAHYPDVRGVTEEIEDEFIEEMLNILAEFKYENFFQNPTPLLLKISRFLEKDEEFYKVLIKSNNSEIFLEKLKKIFSNHMERIRAEGNNRFQKGYEFWNERKAFRKYQPKKIYLKGSLMDSRKITGLKAFYYLFATLLGLYPKQNPHKPLSPELKEAWLKIDRFSEEIRLVHKENLNDLGEVNVFITSVQAEITSTENERQKYITGLEDALTPMKGQSFFLSVMSAPRG